MDKIRKNFYLSKVTTEFLRDFAYRTRKSQSQLIEEALELLKKKMDDFEEEIKL